MIEQVGTPSELYEKPNSTFVAGFIGSPKMNFLKGALSAGFNCHTLGLRSEHIDIVDSNPLWKGRVVHSENLGSDTYVYLDIGGEEPLVIRQKEPHPIPLNTEIGVRPHDEHLYRFDEKGLPLH